MLAGTVTVPQDPEKPGRDVLGVGLDARGHFIHEVMAEAGEPLTPAEIGERAERAAVLAGYPTKPNTFAPTTTRSHLVFLRDRKGGGYAEQLPDGRWQLTARACHKIASARNGGSIAISNTTSSFPVLEVKTVDSKCRILLPREFANTTVTVEMVSPTEARIRKAVVIPESELPLLEDHLRPLSDRDRDFFLDLLDNPPEPTQGLRDAMAKHKKRHG